MSAIRGVLGEPSVKLMRAVTCALSQSGLAHLEQASSSLLLAAPLDILYHSTVDHNMMACYDFYIICCF